MEIYRNIKAKTLIENTRPDIIWREKDLDVEMERFRMNYTRWSKDHTKPTKYREMTADDYIEKFQRHIKDIESEAVRLNWPWEWCIDDLSAKGKYFCPIWVILGDSRIFSLEGDELLEVPFHQEKKLGNNVKRSTRLNDRYRCKNIFFSSNSSINVEAFVCNYFRRKPKVEEGIRLEAGHIYSFDPNHPSTYNNNMLNVVWQTSNDNKSTQTYFDRGKSRIVFEKERRKLGAEIVVPDNLQAMFDASKNHEVEAAIEFHRDKTGINKIAVRTSRGIALVEEE